jgi:hypothetical protein
VVQPGVVVRGAGCGGSWRWSCPGESLMEEGVNGRDHCGDSRAV